MDGAIYCPLVVNGQHMFNYFLIFTKEIECVEHAQIISWTLNFNFPIYFKTNFPHSETFPLKDLFLWIKYIQIHSSFNAFIKESKLFFYI